METEGQSTTWNFEGSQVGRIVDRHERGMEFLLCKQLVGTSYHAREGLAKFNASTTCRDIDLNVEVSIDFSIYIKVD